MKITVVGLGYVGLANAAVLSREHEVVALDIDPERVLTVNSGHSTVEDAEMDDWLMNQPLRLCATTDPKQAYAGADYIVIAVPTNYDERTGHFDTGIVEDVLIDACLHNADATIVIRSTVPAGFTAKMAQQFRRKMLFVPEFLREGSALRDTLNPSRIVVGGDDSTFGKMLNAYSGQGIMMMAPTEAEAVKLFSNTYLAMRVAFFNELDTFALHRDLNTGAMIEAISADPRIGTGYNNPSFGYGGYCLPKDTKQLRSDYIGVPEALISAIVEANAQRKTAIAQHIINLHPRVVGIYRLVMKTGSSNFRDSAVLDIIDLLRRRGIEVLIYEPELAEATFDGCEVVRDLDEFTARSNRIVANRDDDRLSRVREKVYTRDIFGRD